MQFSSDLYERALYYAANAHGKQEYQYHGLPYMVHVAHVTIELFAAIADCAKTGDVLNADLALQFSILHDVIEDTPITHEVLGQVFGKSVADGVLALSKNPQLEKQAQIPDSVERIRQQPREIWMVKLADRIANLYPPPPDRTNEQNKKYYEESFLILEQLGEVSEYLTIKLKERIKDYEKYLI